MNPGWGRWSVRERTFVIGPECVGHGEEDSVPLARWQRTFLFGTSYRAGARRRVLCRVGIYEDIVITSRSIAIEV